MRKGNAWSSTLYFPYSPSLSILVPFPVSDPAPVTVSAPAPAPVTVPVLRSYSRLRPRSRPRPRSFFLRSFSCLLLRPRPRSCSRPRPVPVLVPRTWLPPRYSTRVQTPGLANGAVECPQAPLLVCKDDGARGMKVPAVKQKRIDAKDVLLTFPSPDAGVRWSVSPTCALPV